MRLRHQDGTTVHLGYCSNVHQAEDLRGVVAQLARYAEPVRHALGADLLGIGLWLARDVIGELAADPSAVGRLRRELAARGLETVSLNAFPYQGFHLPQVKKAVYLPAWDDPRRLDYTVACARVLAGLLPDDARRGSVSTLPLAWRSGWTAQTRAGCRRALDQLSASLAALERDTGRPIRVGFEPEPGCIVETTAQAVTELGGLDPERLGICLDTCHLAVQFEDPAAALQRLDDAGLAIVKIQASSALQADRPGDPATRQALARFAEERFLHQTRAQPHAQPRAQPSSNTPAEGVDDLPEALSGGLRSDAPWRVHFHVPLHAVPEPPLRSTSGVLAAVLAGVLGGPDALCDHIEAETYTWSVLPGLPGLPVLPGQPGQPGQPGPAGDGGLIAGLAAEMAWTRDQLLTLGLHPMMPKEIVT